MGTGFHFKRSNKFNVAPPEEREFLGRRWDSKAEKLYAQELELRKKAGDVLDYAINPLVMLAGQVKYRPDFLVIEQDDAYFVDVKGVETERYRVIKQIWPETQVLRLETIKRKGAKWTHQATLGRAGA